ncbi:hypothetical protein M422DRAFT_243701 [Sphaerobolus stellatus SS14]|nr:hypothetical protein M422DRAFT_243701 [Sphaerobolus stellatus SS14]
MFLLHRFVCDTSRLLGFWVDGYRQESTDRGAPITGQADTNVDAERVKVDVSRTIFDADITWSSTVLTTISLFIRPVAQTLLPRTSSAGHSGLLYAVDVDVLFPWCGHRLIPRVISKGETGEDEATYGGVEDVEDNKRGQRCYSRKR